MELRLMNFSNDGMTTEGYRYNDASRGFGLKYGDTVAGHYDVKVNGTLYVY
jgi:hypothetical protein